MILIPIPKKLEIKDGFFKITSGKKIAYENNLDIGIFNACRDLSNEIADTCGIKLPVTKAIRNDGDVKILFNKCMPKEAYTLTITQDKIVITGGMSGCFYGIQTLKQIIRQSGIKLPSLFVEDMPDYKVRSVLHDITRGKIPTLGTLKNLIDRLAEYKINQFMFYVENVFHFDFAREMWVDTGCITAEEIIELDAYCAERRIEMVPFISTFGHLYDLLETKRYCHLAEVEETEEKDYWLAKCWHHTLDVTNRDSIALVKRIIDEYIPLFSSDKIKIGCDETMDLGMGKSAESANINGVGSLYYNFFTEISDYVKSYNKKVMFSGDVIINHPEYLDRLDKDLIVSYWEYNAEFSDSDIKAFAGSGLNIYSSSATSGHASLLPFLTKSCKNLLKHIEYSKCYGVENLIMTDWGDFGHTSPLAASIPAFIYFGALSWNSEKYSSQADFMQFDSDVSRLEYCDDSAETIGILRKAMDISKISWVEAVMYYHDKMGDYPEEIRKRHKIDEMVKGFGKFDGAAEIYKKLMDFYETLAMKHLRVRKKYQYDIKCFMSGIKGVALLHVFLQLIKKYELKQEVAPILNGEEFSSQLMLWLEEFKQLWRETNKESDLKRIVSAIKSIAEMTIKWIN